MSDTPVTDSKAHKVWSSGNYGMGDEYADEVVDAEDMRDMERERNFHLLREEILVAAMSEIKATEEGNSMQPIATIVAGCIKELQQINIKKAH
jgi:hypothetical protein